MTDKYKTSLRSEQQQLSSLMPNLDAVFRALEGLAKTADVQKAQFDSVQSVCLFVGYPRSGHSIIGALLDAHPEIVIAQELDVTRCIHAGMSRNTIFYLLAENSRIFTEQGKKWNSFDYQVEGQWQGKSKKIKVIGDKKGDGLSRVLAKNPAMLDSILETFKVPIKFIHVIRNPFDNVATISRKHSCNLDYAATSYFSMVGAVNRLRTKLTGAELCEVTHEEFIENPKQTIKRLVEFLGLTASDDYLQACARIVNKKPHLSRHDVTWTDFQKARMTNTTQQFSFLKHYQFEGE